MFAPGGESVGGAPGSTTPDDSLASVVPGPHHQVDVVKMMSRDALATGPHHCKEHLDRVDSIMEQPGIAFGPPGRSKADRTVNTADWPTAEFAEVDDFLAESHGRPREERDVGSLGEPKHLAGVVPPAGHRFVDKHRETRREKRTGAFQVWCSREREDQGGVNLADHVGRVVDQVDIQ